MKNLRLFSLSIEDDENEWISQFQIQRRGKQDQRTQRDWLIQIYYHHQYRTAGIALYYYILVLMATPPLEPCRRC